MDIIPRFMFCACFVGQLSVGPLICVSRGHFVTKRFILSLGWYKKSTFSSSSSSSPSPPWPNPFQTYKKSLDSSFICLACSFFSVFTKN
jgi:hypothetical protein